MIDFVTPNNNEEEFISIADKLGYKELSFLYNINDYLDKQKKFKIKNTDIKVDIGILADNRSIYEIKNKLKDEKAFIVVKSSTNDKDIIERLKPNIIFSFEENTRKDFIHQRASGLNHILCKSAKENNVTIGFSIKSILDAENKQEILGRMMQNMKLCRKYKIKTIIASFAQKPLEMRNVHDLASLFEILMGR
ncbi:MAG: hypothetical protein IH934_06225 [Nanoarchaeota archaeon]|nr:hypothetical protein [Nanoarchaeota archaeon]